MTAFALKNAQNLEVYKSALLCATSGANLGDAITFADELVLDDVYELSESAKLETLSLVGSGNPSYRVQKNSSVGKHGAQLFLDCLITLMPPTGATIDAFLFVEIDKNSNVTEIYLHPFASLEAKTPYALVGVERENLRERLALLNCVSFTRGTRITTATGAQKAIEDLKAGDRVLTRDSGIREVRWVGQSTVRAEGDMAPVVITKGTLHNLEDLKVSREHRLFIYQRQDVVGAGQAEVLVKAGDLVNGDTVYVQNGGHVDYFQLLFDDHQIIFAEGIAAETMLVTEANERVLPKEISKKMRETQPGLSNPLRVAREIDSKLVAKSDAAEILRRASTN